MKGMPAHNRIANPPKVCEVCGKSFMRRWGIPQKQWRITKFCSKVCKNIKQKETSRGRKHSVKTRMKMRESARKGASSHLWRGGSTPLLKSLRGSLEYKLWRDSVFKRDNYTCVWCGDRSGKGKRIVLQADHVKPFVLFPELRFAIDNGRTLCIDCHRKTETFGSRVWTFINKET